MFSKAEQSRKFGFREKVDYQHAYFIWANHFKFLFEYVIFKLSFQKSVIKHSFKQFYSNITGFLLLH